MTSSELISIWEKNKISSKKLLSHPSNSKMFQWFESEVLYSLVREILPSKIIEFGPYNGLTSSIIIKAMEANNKKCDLISFDLRKESTSLDYISNLTSRKLVIGDIKETCLPYLDDIDFIFIDADHSYKFGQWYCENVFPKLRKGTIIMIHDWEGYAHNEVEMLAVKECGIHTGIVSPIINLMDHLMKTNSRISFGKGDRSPSQILEKT